MRVNLDTYQHLLPRARAWQVIINKKLRQFFQGLVDLPSGVQDTQDQTWADYRPADTTKLAEWETQFGLLPTDATEQDRRDRLAAAWRTLGGQSPRYLQDAIQAAGFNVYLYESSFARAGTGKCLYRQPWFYLNDGRFPDKIIIRGVMGEPDFQMGEPDAMLASRYNLGATVGIMQMGEPAVQMGEPAVQMGEYRRLGVLLTDPLPAGSTIPVEGQEDEWPYILYWGGSPVLGQPSTAIIPRSREQEFKTLILKLSPAQQWHGLLIDFLN